MIHIGIFREFVKRLIARMRLIEGNRTTAMLMVVITSMLTMLAMSDRLDQPIHNMDCTVAGGHVGYNDRLAIDPYLCDEAMWEDGVELSNMYIQSMIPPKKS